MRCSALRLLAQRFEKMLWYVAGAKTHKKEKRELCGRHSEYRHFFAARSNRKTLGKPHSHVEALRVGSSESGSC